MAKRKKAKKHISNNPSLLGYRRWLFSSTALNSTLDSWYAHHYPVLKEEKKSDV